MRTAVATSHLRVTPGKPVLLDVDVTNTSDIIDGVTATIQGLDPSWVSLVVPVISLFPETSSTLSLRIELPTNCLAGEYLVSVCVVSIIDPGRFSEHEFWLSVEPLLAASVVLHPQVVIGGSHAVFQAAVANEGNITADLVINTLDESRLVNCVAYPATISVPAGETHSVEIHVDGKRPWFGQPVSHSIGIDVSGGDLSLPALATFTQKPRIPRGALTILILVLIVALWATIFLVVISALRDDAAPTKSVATDFNNGGSDNVDLAAVAVTMSGQVTAKSTGAPLPLITVEALRVKPSGDEEPSGSAGTDDDGAFELEALLPGTYKLRFTADGFDELWYPAAADSGSAEILSVNPSAPAEDLNVVLVGKPGSAIGQIVAPENRGSAADITLTVTQVLDDPIEGAPLPDAVQVPVDPTGNFSVAGLVTPATYRLRVEATGFDPFEFDETVAAGQDVVLNTITLGAAAGGFTGTVVSSSGSPLGGVEVVARSGDFEKSTTTPTSGAVGSFTLDALETPRTYTLTLTLAGYSDQTIAVDLGSGETRLVAVTMEGGTAPMSGLVTATDGTPLDGVAVEVGCGEYQASTATLTASGADGQAGTYFVAEVPTPSSCTITFSSTDYISQTIRADVPGPGVITALDAVMPKASGIVEGTVFSNSSATSDVIVELSSGAEPRSTVTATSPAGAYRFSNVEPGDYTLTFRKAGLTTRVAIVTIVPDTLTTYNVELPAG